MYLEEKKLPGILSLNPLQQLVAPVTEWDRDWQMERTFFGDWLLQLARDFGHKRLLLYQIAIGSELYHEVNQKLGSAGFTPVHMVNRDSFFNSSLGEDLRSGVSFVVEVEEILTPQMLEQMQELECHRGQISFVIPARKDVRFRDVYRSFPHLWRDRLYVDFPLSQSPLDPYFSVPETYRLRRELAADFGLTDIPSYCPDVLAYAHEAAQNVSHFTVPRKLSDQAFCLSLISHSPEVVKALSSFPALQTRGAEIELLITRVAGQKTQVVPRVASLLTTRYWIHLKDPGGRVASSLVRNFSATQATGEYVLFLTMDTLYLLEMALEDILEGRSNEESYVRDHGLLLFRTDVFKRIGGFDPLFRLEESQFFDLRHRYLIEKTGRGLSAEQMDQFFAKENPGSEAAEDQRRLLQRFPEMFARIQAQHSAQRLFSGLPRPQFAQAGPLYYRLCDLRDRYLSLYHSTLGVLLEGHLRYLTWPFRAVGRWLSSHAWRIKPSSYPSYWRLRSLLQKNWWRLDPRSAPWAWRVRGQLWRFSPQQLGWHLFRLSYPLRKVYYFTHFQYEKRILGLHHKASRGEGNWQ